MGILETGTFLRLDSDDLRAHYLGNLFENRRSHAQTHSGETQDPFSVLTPEIQAELRAKGWHFGEYLLGQALEMTEARSKEFLPIMAAKKQQYRVLSPPIFDQKGKVLRLGSLV